MNTIFGSTCRRREESLSCLKGVHRKGEYLKYVYADQKEGNGRIHTKFLRSRFVESETRFTSVVFSSCENECQPGMEDIPCEWNV